MNLHASIRVLFTAVIVAATLCGNSPSAQALDGHISLNQCRLDTWSVRDGLPPQSINSIIQTPDGFIWLATGAGLIRFDGTTFHTFNSQNTRGAKLDDLVTLMTSREGDLWAGGSWMGFGTFKSDSFDRVQPKANGWHIINVIHQTPDGAIWAGGFGLNQMFRVSNGKVETFPGFTDSIVGMTDADHGGVLALAYSQGLVKVTPAGKAIPSPLDKQLPVDWYTSMCRTADGDLWIGTERSGLIRITGSRVRRYGAKDGLPSNEVDCVYSNGQGRLWIGTNNGLSCWDGDRFTNFGKADGLCDSDVHSIYEDREGNLWVGAGSALCRFAETKLKPYSIYVGPQSIDLAGYSAFAADPMSRGRHTALYCLTLEGLAHIDDSGIRWVGGPFHQRFEGMAIGPDGLVWLWLHPVNGEDVYAVPLSDVRRDLLPPGQVPAISPQSSLARYPMAKDAQQFNIGFAGQGRLTAFDNSGELSFTPGKVGKRVTLPLGWLFSGETDSTGAYWINSTAGLWRIKGGDARQMQSGNDGTHCLSSDISDVNDIWCATDHGLLRLCNGKTRVYHASDGLPTDEFYQVLDDRLGKIWLGYNSGICSIRKSDVDAFDKHELKTIPVTIYGAEDGIRDYPVNFTDLRTPDGRLWMLGMKGLTVIDPAHMSRNEVAPPVAIVDAVVDNKSIRGLHNTIAPGVGNLRVHFAALTFVAPERVKFAYRLVGIDQGWNYTSDRVAAFGNLPPGNYLFQVRACNNDGVWNETGATVGFEIEPHYYQTWWFRLLICLLGGGAILGVFGMRTSQMRKRTVELEAKVAERTTELRESNDQLEAAKSELEAAFGELSVSNTQLEEIQAELEAQNAELLETRETLAEANERLEKMATTDGLTGLKNHRSFQDQLSIEWQQFQRSLHPLSIVLMDVDKFKQYNDTYGHPGGDEVLRRVAKLIAENVREADFVARYGGEEFVVIAPNTGHEGAVQLAERIREAIERADWPLRAVTASLGVSTSTAATDSAAALVAEADAALYRSKEGGRNRVTPFRGSEAGILGI